MAVYVGGRKVITVEISDIEQLEKGTIIVGDGSGSPALHAVGADDALLVADPSSPAGVDWTADAILNTLIANGSVGIGTSTPNSKLEVVADTPGVVGGFASGTFQVRGLSALINGNAVITGHNSFGGNKQLWYLGSVSSSSDDIAFINRQNAALSFNTNNAQRVFIGSDGNVGIGTNNTRGQLYIDQSSSTAAEPVILLDQADISEEIIEFRTTIGVGNSIEAVGAKTLTTTHFIKVKLPGGLIRYIPAGTIS